MRVLALDTTGAFGSLALVEERVLIEEVPLHSPEGFSTILFDRMRELLARHDWSIGSVDCFAAASGPGSFTGVRVGLTAVKALGEAAGRAALGISNLEALAACGSTEMRAVVIDARRGEVYGAVYDSELQTVREEAVMPFTEWIASLPNGVTEVVVTDAVTLRAGLPKGLLVTEQRVLAGAVGQIASARLLQGAMGDPAAIDANYVRRADAEMNWKDEPSPRTC